MPIRVLHIIGSLRLGGAQVVVKHIVENASDGFEHYIYPLRSQHIDIPIQSHIIKLAYPNYDPRKLLAILSLCKEYDIDIIHAHLHKPILGSLLTTSFHKKPVIIHEHGPISRKGIQYSLYRFFLRLLNQKASRHIAVSKAIATQLEKNAGIDPHCIEVIYNAVDLDTFVPQPGLRESVREELGISTDMTVIGFVGRLSPVKGPDLLLEAFEIAAKNRSDLTLVFVGTGSMEEKLKMKSHTAGLSERVKFLGFRKDVSEIMNIFDIGCMPSRQEPFGIVALEMMSMGIPLVVSSTDGLSELIKDGVNALSLKDLTPSEIAQKITELVNNPQLKKQLQEYAMDDCRQYSIQNLVKSIEKVYQDTLI